MKYKIKVFFIYKKNYSKYFLYIIVFFFFFSFVYLDVYKFVFFCCDGQFEWLNKYCLFFKFQSIICCYDRNLYWLNNNELFKIFRIRYILYK